MLRILVAITLVVTQIAFAAGSDDFSRAAAQADEKSKTRPGDQYPLKVTFNISNQVIHSMEDCGAEFPLGSSFDFVLIVSTSGQIERVLFGPISAYGKCVTSHLRLPQTVARPPSGSWPIHIRVLHGQIRPQQEDPSVPVIADNAGAPPEKAKPASSAYVARVIQIGQSHFIPALQKDVQRWGTNTIRVLYDLDRSGQMHSLRIFCKKPNPWAEETIRRALSAVKFPPIPTDVLKEVQSNRVSIEDVITNRNE
jgi:hypothetical protein